MAEKQSPGLRGRGFGAGQGALSGITQRGDLTAALTRRQWAAGLALWCTAACRRPSQTEIRIATFGGALPIFLAESLRLDRREGIHFVIQEYPGYSRAVEALLAGNADIAGITYDQVLVMAAQGRQVRSFLTITQRLPAAFVVSPKPSRPIPQIHELRGLTVGIPGLGSTSQNLVSHLLLKNGLAADAVSFTSIGSAASAMAAIETGRVDAAVLTIPVYVTLKRKYPNLVVLADLTTAEGVNAVFDVAQYPSFTLTARIEWLARNAAEARAAVRTLLATMSWMRQHSPEDMVRNKPESQRMPDAAADAEAARLYTNCLSVDGKMDPAGAKSVLALLARFNETVRSARIELAATYTDEFVR